MMQGDPSPKACKAAAEAAKSSVKLQGDNQQHNDSGHSSAPYGHGPTQSAAVPGGSPGTSGKGGGGKSGY